MSRGRRPKLVGLTGGIGSGKSTVARLLADRGAFVVDADEVAREVVAPGTPGLARVVAEFGPGVVAADGSLDRAELARTAFSNENQRARLNAILHPLIARRTAELMASAPLDTVRVHDVPLLTELGLANQYDLVIVVDAPDEVRLARLRDRGVAEDDARARMAAQSSRDQRRAIADIVIDNSGNLEDLAGQVERAWRLIERSGPVTR